MFEDAREYVMMRKAAGGTSMLSLTEVCLPTGGPYAYTGKELGKYAEACTCKRPGSSAYQTACFRDKGVGPVDPLLNSANSLLLAPGAASRPSIVND